MGERRFGRVNWLGLQTLAQREVMRFLAVWTQTLAAPLVTAGLFLAVFTLAIGPSRGEVMGVPFLHFLAPGILMMTVIQNAFANTSSSIVIAKVQGNIVDTLMPPLSPGELVRAISPAGGARADRGGG
jgi:ABC-2 type transport system permease protein